MSSSSSSSNLSSAALDESKWNLAKGTARVHDAFTHLEAIPLPFITIIPSALHVIFSLGQMAYGLSSGKDDHFEQGVAGWCQGAKNIVFLGALVSWKAWISAEDAKERNELLNAFSNEQMKADEAGDGARNFFFSGEITKRLEVSCCSGPQRFEGAGESQW